MQNLSEGGQRVDAGNKVGPLFLHHYTNLKLLVAAKEVKDSAKKALNIIHCLARGGGAKFISGLVFKETCGVLKVFRENLLRGTSSSHLLTQFLFQSGPFQAQKQIMMRHSLDKINSSLACKGGTAMNQYKYLNSDENKSNYGKGF